MKDNKDYLDVLIKIQKNPEQNQRSLAKTLGFSLGKFNYILKSLKNKGYIKGKKLSKKPLQIKLFLLFNPQGFC